MTHADDSSLNDTQSWEALADCIDRLVANWEGATEPPELSPLLPVGGLAFRHRVLAELIKVDMEQRWTLAMSPQLLEEYLAQYTDWQPADDIVLDLLHEEYQIRSLLGDAVSAADCFTRYPHLATQLHELLGDEPAQRSTVLQGQGEQCLPEVGDCIDDFELLLQVGQGAFGTVFLARQRSMQRLVALKVGTNRDDDEPQTLAQLDHENIVRVFDQRLLPERQLRLLYMEFVAGGTLQEVIRATRTLQRERLTGQAVLDGVDANLVQAGQLAPDESSLRQTLQHADWQRSVALLGIRCAAGLEHAHRRGVVHRDLKPANILLTASATPKIADFNISYASEVEGATPEAFFGGSLAYMSPEQLAAYSPVHPVQPHEIDARSDLYSLGVVLWELLTGEHPFGREQQEANWLQTVEAMYQRRLHVPEIPPALKAWQPVLKTLQRCLRPVAADRPQTAAELAADLQLVLNPQLAALVDPPQSRWLQWCVRWPALSVALGAVVPNIFAAVFNFTYNRQEIIERLPTGEWLSTFMLVQGVINAIAFPLGVGLVLLHFQPVRQRLLGRSSSAVNEQLRRLMWLGTVASSVSLAAWLVAGLAYPVSMRMLAGQFPLEACIHFFASLAICGLIAASYPFLLLTYLQLRGFQPQLCQGRVAPLAGIDYSWLARRANLHLLLAAIVPLISIALLTLLNTSSRFALGWLSAGGSAGFGLAFWLHQAIHHDVGVLRSAMTNAEEALH
ncbi:MAG: serine/threonine protein kinase [Planctomycetaceae bacterium]|nr:serine/threonine protein kinase [Planctomycetaceae bacterium]